MKVTFSRDALNQALGSVCSIVPRTSISPVCTYVKLECGGADGAVTLVGTDAEVSIRCGLAVLGLEDGTDILLPAERFRAIVSESDAEEIAMETDGPKAALTAGRSRFTLHGLDGESFPEVPAFKDLPTVAVRAADLAEVIGQTHFSVSREPSRFAINGVHFHIDDKRIELAATDGKRLACAVKKIKGKKGFEASAIVPSKMVAEMRKLAEAAGDGDVQLGIEAKHIVMACGDAVLASLLVEGTFPKYQDVVPSDCDKAVLIDRATLASKLRQAAVLTSDETRSVTLTFGRNVLVMESRTPEVGEAKVEMDIDYDGDEVALAFDTRFLRDVLDVLKGDAVKLELKDGTRPGMIREGKEFTYVMMPMKVKD